MPSVRKSDLEERFRLLDRCDRDLDEELDELKNILHFDPALAGIYWRLPIGTNKARPGTEAKLERALRYLLKRMSVKEDDPYLLLRAWVILRLVIAQLDAVRTEKLIREHKFIESLERTILRISDLFTKNLVGQTLRPAIAPRNTMNDGDTSDSKPARERPRRNLKRKRGEMELSQDRTLLYDLFIAVCSTVRQLQLTCDTLDEENELLMWRIKGVLGLASGEDAARTLGASLAIVHQMVQPDVFSEDFIDFQKDLMAPTLWLWNCYVERFGRVESSMDVAVSCSGLFVNKLPDSI